MKKRSVLIEVGKRLLLIICVFGMISAMAEGCERVGMLRGTSNFSVPPQMIQVIGRIYLLSIAWVACLIMVVVGVIILLAEIATVVSKLWCGIQRFYCHIISEFSHGKCQAWGRRLKLRSCRKQCVASVEGKCAVRECQGPFMVPHITKDRNLYSAAKYYSDMFEVLNDTKNDHEKCGSTGGGKRYLLAYDSVFLAHPRVRYKGNIVAEISIYFIYKARHKTTGEIFYFDSPQAELFQYSSDGRCFINGFFDCVVNEEFGFKMIPNEDMNRNSLYTVTYEIGDCEMGVIDSDSLIWTRKTITLDEFMDILKTNIKAFDSTDNKPTQSCAYYAVAVREDGHYEVVHDNEMNG